MTNRYDEQMPVLILRTSAEPITVPLTRDTATLIGRAPNPRRLTEPAASALRGLPLRQVVVPLDQISGNHLAVLARDTEVLIWDLGSRNGSALSLVAGQ